MALYQNQCVLSFPFEFLLRALLSPHHLAPTSVVPPLTTPPSSPCLCIYSLPWHPHCGIADLVHDLGDLDDTPLLPPLAWLHPYGSKVLSGATWCWQWLNHFSCIIALLCVRVCEDCLHKRWKDLRVIIQKGKDRPLNSLEVINHRSGCCQSECRE